MTRLGDVLDDVVLPALFRRLDQAFPEFGWEATPDGWVATNRETTKRVIDARPDRVVCHRPCGFHAFGGASVSWTAYVSGGQTPRGEAFALAVQRLAELAGVALPDRPSAEEVERARAADARRAALEAVVPLLQGYLAELAAEPVRAYLVGRGLNVDAQAALGVGFLPSVTRLRRDLPKDLVGAAKDAGLLWEKLEGYALFPWRDDWGRPLTLYGRWPEKAPPEGRPKTIALPGSGTKSSPFCFDRARAARHEDLVLVEGVLDAALLQAAGDTRVVACVGAQLARAQVETLARHRVRSVTVCLDPDGAGDKGTLACLRDLEAAGIAGYVAPRLPDGLDPDELVLRDGVAAWRAHVARAVGGVAFQVEQVLAGITPESPRVDRDRALERVGPLVAALPAQAVRERDEIVARAAAAIGAKPSAVARALPVLIEAVRASLRILDVAPPAIALPAFAAIWRAPLGPCDFSLYLVGSTGVLKTSFAAVIQQHWGALLHHGNLPGSWESSGNALEGLASVAKDALFTIDDFVPAGSSQDRAKKHKEADRVLRGQANGTGRQRMRADASLRPTRRSRALVVATGEELPRGESLHARLLVLPVGPGEVHAERLAACQRDGAAGLYSQALAGYLRWLASKPDAASLLGPEVALLRAGFVVAEQHKRTAEIAANLFLGLRAFHRFAESIGLHDAATSAALLEERRTALLQAVGLQSAVQAEANPVRRFFELLGTSLASGRAHVAGPDGRVPAETPFGWGWRLTNEGKAEREDDWRYDQRSEPIYMALGDRIGWVVGDDLYLDPDAAHAIVHRAAGEEGFPLSPRVLRRRLREAGLLRTVHKSRETCSTRVTLGGVVRPVLHLGVDVLRGGEDAAAGGGA